MSDSAPTLDVRPARPGDRDAVFAFCAHTWPEGDYIPDVWDDWLADPDGALLVAVRGERPMGLVRLRMMSPEEGWIEGIRVDPAARGQGIGRVLVSRALAAAHERGATVVLLFTDHDNLPAQAIFARFGFTRIAEVVRYRAPALEDAPETLAGLADAGSSASTPDDSPAAPVDEGDDAMPEGARITTPGADHFERVWAWLVQSNLAPLTGGLEFDGWSARALTEPFLRGEMAAGRVYVLEEWDTILALAVVQDFLGSAGEPSSLDVRYIDGLSESIGRLAFVLREVAQERGLSGVTLWLPDLLILHDAMDGAGYASESDAMWVYARTL
ncbi:MAG TPA: GNAT family N-acetyltransferase [Ktedonobacterales bacterium]|nr:GNAT family N-acetyltransferase [Ktedonobacterales bacterium]